MFVGIWIHLSFVGRARRTARSALGLLYNIRRFFILRQWFKCEHFANCPPPGHRPFLFYRLLTVDLPPIQRCAAEGEERPPPSFLTLSRGEAFPPIQRRAAGGDFTPSEGVVIGRLRRQGMPGSPGRDKRGRDTKVSLPLLTPQPFLWTRLPPVARLKARGPQGRLVLQGITLD